MHEPDDPKTRSTEADTDAGEGFYGRWSRRKRLDRAGLAPPEPASPPAPGEQPAAAAGDEPAAIPEASELTDADMPALESLDENSDYSPFMSPGVSEALRNRALRKLFMSSQFNVLDGLNEYDDDFTTFEALGDIVTSDMRHRLEMEVQRARAKAEEEARAMLAGDEGEGAEEVPDAASHAPARSTPQALAEQEHPGRLPGQTPSPLAGAGEAAGQPADEAAVDAARDAREAGDDV